MFGAARSAFITWAAWGFAAGMAGFANLAVVGFHPTPNQQWVNYGAIPIVALVASVITQMSWPSSPKWSGAAFWFGSMALAFASSPLQKWLGDAGMYGRGGASEASMMAPMALFCAIWAAGLTVALVRRAAWWPGALLTAAYGGLYVWASSWNWGGASGKLLGAAVLCQAALVGFVLCGAGTAAITARKPAA